MDSNSSIPEIFDDDSNIPEIIKQVYFSQGAGSGSSIKLSDLVNDTSSPEIAEENTREIDGLIEEAKRGNVDAMLELVDILIFDKSGEDHSEEILYWTQLACEKGSDRAVFKLGLMYYYGMGIKQDGKKAFEYIHRAATAGDVDAMILLAVIYHDGEILPKDIGLAFAWYKKAAEAGNVDAMYQVGLCYLIDEGIAQNIDEGKKWLKMAGDNGSKEAADFLKEIENL